MGFLNYKNGGLKDMRTDVMINQLRNVAKKHENDKLFTFDTNITQMCTDSANRIEELYNGLIKLNENIESLIDVAHDTYMACEDKTEKIRLDGQIKAYWNVKGLVEDILQVK